MSEELTPEEKNMDRILRKYDRLGLFSRIVVGVSMPFLVAYFLFINPYIIFTSKQKIDTKTEKYKTPIVEQYYNKCETLRNLEWGLKDIQEEEHKHYSHLKEIIESVREDSIKLAENDEVCEYLYHLDKSKEQKKEINKKFMRRLFSVFFGYLGILISSTVFETILGKKKRRVLKRRYPGADEK